MRRSLLELFQRLIGAVAAAPETSAVLLGLVSELYESGCELVIGRIADSFGEPGLYQPCVDKEVIVGSIEIEQQSVIAVSGFCATFNADSGSGRKEPLESVGGLRAKALHGHTAANGFWRVNTDESYPFDLPSNFYIDGVPVDDVDHFPRSEEAVSVEGRTGSR